jgi:hypothetical protein
MTRRELLPVWGKKKEANANHCLRPSVGKNPMTLEHRMVIVD